jgi:polyisoprenyl-phosphate glycosyltransferase
VSTESRHTPPPQRKSALHVVVLMPLHDDWASASELILRLDRVICSYPCKLDVLIIDDCSVLPCKTADFECRLAIVQSIRVLRLRRNLGHQRAIAIGLVYIEQCMSCDAVLVMDADGEDTPEGALELLRAYDEGRHQGAAIFAERSRRSESLLFRVFYQVYKVLHRILTGVSVRVGNFSIVPAACLHTLVVMSELWNHYAAAFFRSRLPFTTIPIPRGRRIMGTSRMNFVTLTAHGMSAISVFGDVVGVRLLMGSIFGSLLAALGIITVILIRLLTDKAVPGWATYAVGTLVIILSQLITIGLSFTFTMLSNRINLGFVPLRDYSLFVADVRIIKRTG